MIRGELKKRKPVYEISGVNIKNMPQSWMLEKKKGAVK